MRIYVNHFSLMLNTSLSSLTVITSFFTPGITNNEKKAKLLKNVVKLAQSN